MSLELIQVYIIFSNKLIGLKKNILKRRFNYVSRWAIAFRRYDFSQC